MPRDPFLMAAKAYLEDLRPYWRPLTVEQRRRDLNVIGRDLWTLRKGGKVANVTPTMINEDDIGALLLCWRTRLTRGKGPNRGKPMDPSTQAHLFGVLRKFLQWCGNASIARIEARGHARFPKTIEKPIEVLSLEQLERVRRSAEVIEGWPGCVARFLASFCPSTGLRPKEVREQDLEGLDTVRWRILVSHPKGECSWAAPDYAPILPFGREATLDFLAERQEYLVGEPCNALIPYRRVSGDVGPWSAAMLRELKGQLEKGSGVRFSLKTFRATFGQLAKDRGVSIEAVSRAMRHKSTKTTEAFYARIRSEKAFLEIEDAFRPTAVVVAPERVV